MNEVSVDAENKEGTKSGTGVDKEKDGWNDKEEGNMSEDAVVAQDLATHCATSEVFYPEVDVREKGKKNTNEYPPRSEGDVKDSSGKKGPEGAEENIEKHIYSIARVIGYNSRRWNYKQLKYAT